VTECGAAGSASLTFELIERIHNIAEEMKAVSNLNRVGCAQTYAIADAETAVTRDDLGAGVCTEPRRQGCGLIVRQHVDGPTHRQVHHAEP
jgi:hypothetical protein